MSAIRQRLAKPGWYRVAFTPLTVRSGALLQLKEGIDISLPAGGTPHPSGGRAANGCAAECLHQRHQSLATQPKAVGTSHGWIQKIESGKKMPGFFLAIKLAVFLEIDMNSFLKDLIEASGTPITASKRQESLVHTDAAKESGDTEVTGHVQV